jgi:hypothetical protein
MIRFLRDLHARRSFDPFTTWDLSDEIRADSGLDVHERFRLWLYQSAGATRAAAPSPWDWLHEVDVALPAEPSGRQRQALPSASRGRGPRPASRA